MAQMQEIYKEMAINSIINDKNYLKKLIEFYKSSHRPLGRYGKKHRDSAFYVFLVKSKNNYVDDSTISIKDYQNFYIKMTKNWIKNILSLDESELKKLADKGLGGYKKIKNILQVNSNVSSMDDIEDLYKKINYKFDYYGEIEDKDYFWRHAQDGYYFDATNEYSEDFIHINSIYGKARQEKNEHVDYRIYINCANKDLFKLVNKYVDYCEQNNIHYYFKYMPWKKRKDKIVFYISKENLEKNIAILKQIGKENPEIISNCGEGLELVGKIDKWIGLASEPDSKLTYKHSFNTLRAEILEDAAEKITLDFIKDNFGNIEIKRKILDCAINTVISEMSKENSQEMFTNSYKEYLKAVLTQKIPNTNISSIRYGFERLEQVAPQKNELTLANFKPIFQIKQPNGNMFDYSIITADKVLKAAVDIMIEYDSNYLDKYYEEIKAKCEQNYVDPNNIALNTSSLDDFIQLDNNKQKIVFKENDVVFNSIQNSLVYIHGLLSKLSDEQLNMKISGKYFNSNEDVYVSLRQYAEEYLSSRLDEKYNFITENGEKIPVAKIVKSLIQNNKNYESEETNSNDINQESLNNFKKH